MIRNENGIAVPSDSSPLPWRFDDYGDLVDKNGRYVTDEEGLYHTVEAGSYTIHATKFHPRLADIVRRLAVWHEEAGKPHGTLSFKLFDITSEAAKVWAEMREDGVE